MTCKQGNYCQLSANKHLMNYDLNISYMTEKGDVT